jgi:micrococcal nuclease
MKKLIASIAAALMLAPLPLGIPVEVNLSAPIKQVAYAEQKNIQAKVISVVDGDTFKVKIGKKEETVRMLLVDTPETKHPKLGVQPFGPEASVFTKKLLTGKTVSLEKDVGDARDKYGRLLMYVYVDGKSVQEQLLAKGLARVAYVYPPNVKYVDKYREIQKKAQKAGIGIWSIENYAQEDGFHSDAVKNKSNSKPKSPQTSQTKPSSKQKLIKGNINSKGEKIYHVPGGAFYDRTNAEEWFATEAEARAAGYRKSKR